MFLVVAENQKLFSSLPYSAKDQVCRSWEGAQPGREPSWPVEIFRTIDTMIGLRMEVGRGGEGFLFFLISMGPNPLLSGSSNFSGNMGFFW